MAKSKPVPVLSSRAQERRWQAENDLRTMQQFAELQRNPSRLKAAEAMVKEQLAVLSTVKKK